MQVGSLKDCIKFALCFAYVAGIQSFEEILKIPVQDYQTNTPVGLTILITLWAKSVQARTDKSDTWKTAQAHSVGQS